MRVVVAESHLHPVGAGGVGGLRRAVAVFCQAPPCFPVPSATSSSASSPCPMPLPVPGSHSPLCPHSRVFWAVGRSCGRVGRASRIRTRLTLRSCWLAGRSYSLWPAAVRGAVTGPSCRTAQVAMAARVSGRACGAQPRLDMRAPPTPVGTRLALGV